MIKSNHWLILSIIFLSPSTFASSTEEDLVKIQISNSGQKPWANLGDGSAIITFDAAVHGHALYFTPDLNIKPGYIKSWKWDDKKNSFHFKMDKERKYHNGTPISAYDFELVLIKPFITAADVGDKAPLTVIKGTRNLKVGMKFKSGMAEGIHVIDDENLEVKLKSKHSRFLYALGRMLPALAPISEFKDDYFTFKNLPVGSGQYKIAWSDPKSSLVRLERAYGSSGPKFVELYTQGKAWENGVDIALGAGRASMAKYIVDHPGSYTRLQGHLPDSIEVIEFNFQTKAGSNLDFRRAVALAIDNEIEIPGFSSQTPTDQIIPILSYGFKKPKNWYNLEKSKQIFALLPKDIRDATHKIEFHGEPGQVLPKYYEFIKQSLEKIGMKVSASLSPATVFQKGDTENAMIMYGRFIDNDPVTAFAHYLPGNDQHHVPEQLPEFIEVFKKADSVESIENRVQLINKMTAILRSHQIVLPLHQRHPVYFYNDKIKSMGIDENAWNIDISKIELNRRK